MVHLRVHQPSQPKHLAPQGRSRSESNSCRLGRRVDSHVTLPMSAPANMELHLQRKELRRPEGLVGFRFHLQRGDRVYHRHSLLSRHLQSSNISGQARKRAGHIFESLDVSRRPTPPLFIVDPPTTYTL